MWDFLMIWDVWDLWYGVSIAIASLYMKLKLLGAFSNQFSIVNLPLADIYGVVFS